MENILIRTMESKKGEKNMRFSSKIYDILKILAQVVLPALGTLYFALAEIWGLPYAPEIVGTISAIDAFLGAMLHISTIQYNKELDAIE